MKEKEKEGGRKTEDAGYEKEERREGSVENKKVGEKIKDRKTEV